MPTLLIHDLPRLVSEADLGGGTVVVIDQLRASSTICQALASGATEVTALLEVDDALRAAEVERAAGRGDDLVLGGERGGQRIAGFDLGNSPTEYTLARVAGRRLLFTTTNGTRALRHARRARRVLVGSALNLSRVVSALGGETNVHLLCAGTDGERSRDDTLVAGAIAHRLAELEGAPRAANRAVESAIREWLTLLEAARERGRTPAEQLAEELRETPGGRNLIEIGMDRDLRVCAEIDALDVLPEYDPATGRVSAG
ncbi:MAG: 2-phosphosulfolactate phosphatase [Lacipirellulaceae bacterium]